MNVENLLKEMNWKKGMVIALIVIAAFCVLHEIFFWTAFHETRNMLASFNSQMIQQQKEIQQVLNDSEKEFKEKSKEMDARSKDFNNLVDQMQDQIKDDFVEIEHERKEREKAFDKAFEEAPAKMWTAYNEARKKMMKSFLEDREIRQKAFQHHLDQKFSLRGPK